MGGLSNVDYGMIEKIKNGTTNESIRITYE